MKYPGDIYKPKMENSISDTIRARYFRENYMAYYDLKYFSVGRGSLRGILKAEFFPANIGDLLRWYRSTISDYSIPLLRSTYSMIDTSRI